jgi:hypothetical protein
VDGVGRALGDGDGLDSVDGLSTGDVSGASSLALAGGSLVAGTLISGELDAATFAELSPAP